jgi:hypothetical protein
MNHGIIYNDNIPCDKIEKNFLLFFATVISDHEWITMVIVIALASLLFEHIKDTINMLYLLFYLTTEFKSVFADFFLKHGILTKSAYQEQIL